MLVAVIATCIDRREGTATIATITTFVPEIFFCVTAVRYRIGRRNRRIRRSVCHTLGVIAISANILLLPTRLRRAGEHEVLHK